MKPSPKDIEKEECEIHSKCQTLAYCKKCSSEYCYVCAKNMSLPNKPTDKEIKKEKGCPCGAFGKCCEQPEVFTPDHECSDEVVCEECYVLQCMNCGATCSHEL